MEDVRRELAHRPLLLAAIALCVGLTAVLHPLNLLFLLPILWPRRPLPVALAFVLGLTLAPRPAPMLLAQEWVSGPARILSVPYETPEGLIADVEVESKRLRAKFPSDTLASRGDVWRVQGNAKPLSEIAQDLRLKGIQGKLSPLSLQKLHDGPLPWRLADAWRRGYAAFAKKTLKETDARWLLGFAFRQDAFDDEERDALADTGTVHLIAASGVHVAAVGFLAMTLASWMGAPRKAALAAVLTIVLFYAMATGLHLPTLRAALAFAAGSSAYLFRREPDGLSALSLAVLAYLPFDPAGVYGIGFQLSTAVVGMLVLWPRRDVEPQRTASQWFRHHARDLTAVSLVAALAAEPILACREGEIALLTVPANFLAVPPAMAAILLGFVFHPLNATWAMPLVGGLVAFAREGILLADRVPRATFAVPPFSPYLLLLWFVPWLWFWRPRARPAD